MRTFLWRSALGAASFSLLSAAYAGTPLWTFSALSNTSFSLSSTDTATVQYRIYNQSQRAKTLVLNSALTPGVQQTTPCVLPPKSQNGSCLLTLQINGNAIPASGIHGGPVLCQANGDGSPNRNQCYQPAMGSALDVKKASVPQVALAITPSTIRLKTFDSTPQTITITNLSANITATNINAIFAGTPIEGYVSASSCASVAPGASCTMTFTSGRTVVAPTTFAIQGTNTSAASAILNVSASFVYVTGASTDAVYRCPIDDSNLITEACVDSGAGAAFDQPQGIAINKQGTYAYVVNGVTPTGAVIKCAIDDTGSFSSCNDAGGNLPLLPVGIALSADGSNAFVAMNGQTVIRRCPINPDTGDFIGVCPIAAVTSDYNFDPNGITLNAANTFAYISAPGNGPGNPQLFSCQVNADLTLSSCVANPPSFDGAHAIALNNSQTIGYVTNTAAITGGISQCAINSVTGVFDACTMTAFTEPTGFGLNAEGNWAYISSYSTSTVSSCPLNSDGSLGSCVPSPIIPGGPNLQFLTLG